MQLKHKFAFELTPLLLWAATALAAGPQAADVPPAPDTPPRNVILISWDGLDRSVLKELLEADKLPNVAALIKEGSLQEIEVKGHATATKPSHAEMLTGLAAKTTGVRSNSDYQPIPEGYTILERVQQRYGKENIRAFMVTSKIGNVGGRGPEPGADLQGQKDNPKREKKGEPFFLTKKSLDVFDSADRNAAETGPLCLKRLEQFKSPRFIAFFHFSDPDHAGHAHGSDSPQYRAAAVECDQWLGRIVGWLKENGLYGQTLVYATADHGFDAHAATHKDAPHSWLVTNDKAVTRGGILADVPATILARFGVDLSKLDPPLIGKPLTDQPEAQKVKQAA